MPAAMAAAETIGPRDASRAPRYRAVGMISRFQAVIAPSRPAIGSRYARYATPEASANPPATSPAADQRRAITPATLPPHRGRDAVPLDAAVSLAPCRQVRPTAPARVYP